MDMKRPLLWVDSHHALSSDSYLPTYKVLICLRCRYAIQPGALTRHLKEIHSISRSDRQRLVDFASEFKLARPEDVVFPDEIEFPLPLLLIQEGLACCFNGCAHLCATTKRMKQHWCSTHRVSASDDGTFWRPVPLQSFFRGNAFRYFTNPALLASTSAPPSHSSADDLTANGLSTTTATTAATSPACLASTLSSSGLLSSGITDQKLLNQYASSTYKTLSSGPETDDAFLTITLDLGSRFPFLMHSVLACSALHLASTEPANSSYYTSQSLRHQDQAIPDLRLAILHVDRDNSQAILAFAFFFVVCAQNSSTQCSKLFLVDEHDDPAHWFHLLRNGCSTLCFAWDDLSNGPLAPLVALWEDDPGIVLAADPNDPLLATILAAVAIGKLSHDKYQAYRDAAAKLTVAFTFMMTRGPAVSIWDALNAWPMHVESPYLALLRESRPGALLLLAYFAVPLCPFQDKWLLGQRLPQLIEEIRRRLVGSCSPEIWRLFSEIRRVHFKNTGAIHCLVD
ncbi:hypothetical protein BDW74DRAFT_188093 [Aspergillus multicolor]|uniref:uncharacterized protein n=1 Tax=Aspergillus multicolor TaxID=41759 RepID=UPI003CCCDAC0